MLLCTAFVRQKCVRMLSCPAGCLHLQTCLAYAGRGGPSFHSPLAMPAPLSHACSWACPPLVMHVAVCGGVHSPQLRRLSKELAPPPPSPPCCPSPRSSICPHARQAPQAPQRLPCRRAQPGPRCSRPHAPPLPVLRSTGQPRFRGGGGTWGGCTLLPLPSPIPADCKVAAGSPGQGHTLLPPRSHITATQVTHPATQVTHYCHPGHTLLPPRSRITATINITPTSACGPPWCWPLSYRAGGGMAWLAGSPSS